MHTLTSFNGMDLEVKLGCHSKEETKWFRLYSNSYMIVNLMMSMAISKATICVFSCTLQSNANYHSTYLCTVMGYYFIPLS